jgi:tape measure domain-containing protein
MPTEVLRIIVDDQGGARVVARNLENLGKSGDRAASSMDFLKKAVLGVGAAAVVRKFVSLNDEFVRMTNTLRPSFKTLAETKSALKEIADAAARSNADLGTAVETYDAMSDALGRLGLSHEQILPLTETLLKQFQLGGQSADQAQTSVKALGAALASNDFSRAITTLSRQNLDFANSIAKAFGAKSVEELRRFVKEGRVTAESFVAAVNQMKEETDKDFEKLGPTIGGAAKEAASGLGLLITNVLDAAGISSGAAKALKDVAQGLRDVAGSKKLLESVALTTGVGLDALGLESVSRGALEERLNQLRELQRLQQGRATFFDDPSGLGQLPFSGPSAGQVQAEIERLEAELQRRFKEMRSGAPASAATGGGADVPSFTAEEIEKRINAFNRLRASQDPLIAAQQRYNEEIRIASEAVLTGEASQEEYAASVKASVVALQQAQQATDPVVERFNALQASLNPASAAAQKYTEDMRFLKDALDKGKISQDAYTQTARLATEELIRATQVVDPMVERFNALVASLNPASAAAQKYTEDMRLLKGLLDQGRISQEAYTQAVQGSTAELIRATQVLDHVRERFNAIQASVNPASAAAQKYTEDMRFLKDALDQGKVSQEEYSQATQGVTQQLIQATQTASGGFFDSLVVGATSAADAITSFATGATGSFKDFVKNLTLEVAKAVVQYQLLKAAQAAAGSGGGSGAGGGAGGGGTIGLVTNLLGIVGGIAGFAEGGRVGMGRPILVGERGPELFVPPSTGNIVPNEQLGGGGGGNVTIVNVLDQAEVARMIGSAEGEKAIMNTISKNRGRVKQSISA